MLLAARHGTPPRLAPPSWLKHRLKPTADTATRALLGACLFSLSLILVACGSNNDTVRRARAAAAQTSDAEAAAVVRKADADKDNDIGAPYDDTSHDSVLNYGHEASTIDKRAVTSTIKRYYAIATAGNGAAACAMLPSSLAEAMPENYGHGSSGPAYLSAGRTCAQIMTLLFKHFYDQLAADLPLLKVRRVRLVGRMGHAVLSFGTMPEREISVSREGVDWKLSPIDTELP
jgi:hypothetical protein